jgi:hypothetical protein
LVNKDFEAAIFDEEAGGSQARVLRQEMFSIEYVKCNFKADIAAQKAGITVGTARNWLKDPMVSAYIDELIANRRARLQMSLDRELIKMSEIVDKAILKEDYRAAVAGQKAVMDAVTEKNADQGSRGPMLQLVFGSAPGVNNGLPQPAYDVEGVQELLDPAIEVSGCADEPE